MNQPLPPSPHFDEEELKARVGPAAYHVLRHQGTEPPFSGAYHDAVAPGVYRCKACGHPLFRGEDQFVAGCGWPSFTDPIEPGAVSTHRDTTHGMVRTEVRCARCGSHQGHVFDDGPGASGLRFCINSVAIEHENGAT